MPFQKHGFLGQQATDNIQNIRKLHPGLFQLVDEVNEYTQKTITDVRLDSDDLHECLIGTLFAKMFHSFQAAVILSQYGLESDSKIILRALFDAIFVFGSIIEDREFAEKYVEHERVLQLKRVNAAISNAKDLKFSKEAIRKLRDRKNELERELGIEHGQRKDKQKAAEDSMFSSEQLDRRAGLNAMYQSGYRILSDDVHTSPFSIEAFLNIAEGERIKSIRLGPKIDSINKNLCVAMSILLQALAGLCALAKMDRDAEITELQKRVANFEA